MADINDRISLVIENSKLSKTDFAAKINVSQQYVSKLSKDGVPSDRTLLDICREFKISENWLRTGEGEMFVHVTRSQEISEFIGDVLKGEADTFKRRFVAMLARLDESDWEFLEEKAIELVGDNHEKENRS